MEDKIVEARLIYLALSKISQIRSLLIGNWRNSVDANYEHDITKALTSTPLPLLQELELYLTTPLTDIGGWPRHTMRCMDPSLLLRAPALRAYAHDTLFSFASPMLTSLDTTSHDINIETNPRHLVDMLRGFPLLEKLRLIVDYGMRGLGTDSTSVTYTIPWSTFIVQPVVLEHLQSASIHTGEQQTDVLGLWSCIWAPANTSVWLIGVDLAQMASHASHALERQLQNPTLDTLLVSRFDGTTVQLRSSRSMRNTAGPYKVILANGLARGDTDYSQMPAIVSSVVSALRTSR